MEILFTRRCRPTHEAIPFRVTSRLILDYCLSNVSSGRMITLTAKSAFTRRNMWPTRCEWTRDIFSQPWRSWSRIISAVAINRNHSPRAREFSIIDTGDNYWLARPIEHEISIRGIEETKNRETLVIKWRYILRRIKNFKSLKIRCFMFSSILESTCRNNAISQQPFDHAPVDSRQEFAEWFVVRLLRCP